MLQIREMAADEVPLLKDFAPPRWHTDISQIFARHFGQPYFHPIAADLDGAIVGCASGLVHGHAGWLGNIIVLPEQRGQGIGLALTQALVEFLQQKRLKFQILIATPMGEPIYRKLGFEIVSRYVFFAKEGASRSTEEVAGVRALRPEDEQAILDLDLSVTGEKRQAFLRGFLREGWVHTGPRGVDGYFLPSLGNGLVVASNDGAGLALMQHKLNQGASSSVVPEQNKVAADFLRSSGFVETEGAPRMTLGPDAPWKPERIYCRGSGYCG